MQQSFRVVGTARVDNIMTITEENALHAIKTAKLALALRNTIALHVPKGC